MLSDGTNSFRSSRMVSQHSVEGDSEFIDDRFNNFGNNRNSEPFTIPDFLKERVGDAEINSNEQETNSQDQIFHKIDSNVDTNSPVNEDISSESIGNSINQYNVNKSEVVESVADGTLEIRTVASGSYTVHEDHAALLSLQETVANVRQLARVLSERAEKNDARLNDAIVRLDLLDRDNILRMTTSDNSISVNQIDEINPKNDGENTPNAFAADRADESCMDDADCSMNSRRTRSVSELTARRALGNRQTIKVRAQFGRIRNEINAMLNEGATKFRLLGLDLSRFHETIGSIKDRIFVGPEVE